MANEKAKEAILKKLASVAEKQLNAKCFADWYSCEIERIQLIMKYYSISGK